VFFYILFSSLLKIRILISLYFPPSQLDRPQHQFNPFQPCPPSHPGRLSSLARSVSTRLASHIPHTPLLWRCPPPYVSHTQLSHTRIKHNTKHTSASTHSTHTLVGSRVGLVGAVGIERGRVIRTIDGGVTVMLGSLGCSQDRLRHRIRRSYAVVL
jgi:hypothetical protein